MARKKTPMTDKKLYLEFVWLSPSEHAHLLQLMGQAELDRWILELNGALGQHGYKYESHYYTIQNWARRAGKNRSIVLNSSSSEGAADRVIELLKDPQGQLPTSEEKVKLAVWTMLRSLHMTWPLLRFRLKENPTIEARIREEFLKAYNEAEA